MAESQVRQNYAKESEKGVNDQINLELRTMYTMLSMSYHFDRDDVALPGFAKYFREVAKCELEEAERFMKFQNDRGGRVKLHNIRKPKEDEWGDGLKAMEEALALQKEVNDSLIQLHTTADQNEDPEMGDFIEAHYLTVQVKRIKQMGDHITNLKRVGPGHGEYHFDRETLGED